MQHAPLVEVTRGNDIESIHFGSVAVVNARGELLYQAGDPDFLTFTRSTLKPFQALPFLQAGGPAHFGFAASELALLCASHSGEPMHTDAVKSILRKAGCTEHQLRCGRHEPMFYAATGMSPPADETYSQLHHNCSGKHAGFLACCALHGHAPDTYLDPRHPVQQAIRTAVAHVASLTEADLHSGIDGCSAPNYAMPLSRLALAYARLAAGSTDTLDGEYLNNLFNAMTMYPELVSGTGRSDLAFMQTAPGDWVAKVGAEGVQALGIRSAGLGIAVKIADGNPRALYTATISVLQQLGVIQLPEATPLAQWVRPQLKNFAELRTGEVRAVVDLARV
jgi:L-asparaginase II